MGRVLARGLIALSVIAFLAGLFFASPLSDGLLTMTVQANALMQSAPVTFTLLFFISFVAVTCVGLPGGALFSILSGYFFGFGMGVTIALAATTTSALGTWGLIKVASFNVAPNTLTAQRNAVRRFILATGFSAPLLIRVIPIFPFYLVNVSLSASGISFTSYVNSTVLGLLPSTMALVSIGKGVQDTVANQAISLSVLLTNPHFYLPLTVLTALTLCAIVLQRRVAQSQSH